MPVQATVTGVFKHIDGVLDSIDHAKAQQWPSYQVYSPVPNHDIEHAIDKPRSSVRWFTLLGGLTGVSGGFFVALYGSYKWGLFLGGKPPGSWIPFVVVGFEMLVLFGAILTLLGVFYLARMVFRLDAPGYDERFTQDCFGICVQCAPEESDAVKKVLNDFGAAEVRVEEREVEE